jgi:hypothetical protein
MTPEIFAPGIISTAYGERFPAFTPDGKELYWALWGAPHGVILHTKEVDGHWTKPVVAPFSGQYQGDFNMSQDGNTIVFGSKKPFKQNGIMMDSYCSWIVRRDENGWGKAEPFGSQINIPESFAGCPTIANNGNLYFFSSRSGGIGIEDIWCSKFENGKYSDAVNLGKSINCDEYNLDPFIAPDESYLIFCRRTKKGGYGRLDLYISFRNDNGEWAEAINMGEDINSEASEYCPMVSTDGKYFFFTSNRKIHKEYSETPISYEEKLKILNNPGNGSADIYWVDAKIIEQLKTEELK